METTALRPPEHGKPMELQWVKTPLQTRSKKTLARILDAAENLLVERGFDGVSVAEIAEISGTSVGTIYARFRDKDGLLNVLHQRFCEEAGATMTQWLHPDKWAGADTVEVLRALVHMAIRTYRERAGLFRAFLLQAATDPGFTARAREMEEALAASLQTLLAPRAGDLSHPNPPHAIVFGMSLVISALQSRFVLCKNAELQGPPDEALEAELLRMYTSYLGLGMTGERQTP